MNTLTILSRLRSQFADLLLPDDAVTDRYAVDWGGVNPQLPMAVARPASAQQLSRLLAFCHAEKLPVVTQGGLTGLSGGATPQPNELAISTERLRGIVELDIDSMTITARAGTPLEEIQRAAEEAGLLFPLDLGARGTATIGGNLSTNAGGNAVINYGMTRALVLGLEAVLADGTVVNASNKMLKNNAGYDLKHLFVGSEGTLGVITEVTLRLYPQAKIRNSAICAFDNFEQVIRFLHHAQASLNAVTAFETMWRDYFDMVLQFNPDIVDPFNQSYPVYVLLQADGVDPEAERVNFERVLTRALENGDMLDAVIAQSHSEAKKFWHIRDGIAAILSADHKLANFDIGVPISRMQDFVAAVNARLGQQFDSLSIGVFGHIADGNLHIAAWTDDEGDIDDIYRSVYALIGEYQGTVTAEHGIGVSKKDYLSMCRSPQEIELMRLLKRSLDPNNILNPGRVVDLNP